MMWLLFYLLGSFIAFMSVLAKFSEENRNPTMEEIMTKYPEAPAVFIMASVLSWIYVAIDFLLYLWRILKNFKK